MKDPFRPADRWIRCPQCGDSYGYNVGRGELPLCELSCSCGYQFKSSDPRRKVCKLPENNAEGEGNMWDNDEIQFARLLAELSALGLTQEDKDTLCASMDLEPDELESLFVRAEKAWNTIKHSRPLAKKPFSDKELKAIAAQEEPLLTAIISVDWDETGDIEQLNDLAEEAIIGDRRYVLSDIGYSLVGSDVANQRVWIQVTALVEKI